mmetsp:Transcript_24429/g.34242  ORF Transcript_24429/g.34242 Transcript_24429/m.34242 type:complete len:436 (-) Transcript_24429:355-1662(-)
MSESNDNEESLWNINPFTMQSFSNVKHDYMGEFDTERWYSWIEPYTFKTIFLPLTIDEARAIVAEYRYHMLFNTANHANDTNNNLKENPIYKNVLVVRESLKAVLAQFEQKVEESLKSFPEGAFVRLSTRSPKDAPLNEPHPDIHEWIHDEFTKINPNYNHKVKNIPPNDVVRSVYNAAARGMKVTHVSHALWLLTHSDRVFTDLRHSISRVCGKEWDAEGSFEVKEGRWDMRLVVREWYTFDVNKEFRCFVVHKKLTAISQYNDLLFYQDLQGKEKEIANVIETYFNQFADAIKFPYFVIDFVILPDWTARVIEINPFGAMTGGPLFNYQLYQDRWILQGGQDLWGDLEEMKSKQTENDNSLSNVQFPVVRLLKAPHPQITYEYVYGYFGFVLQYFDKKFNNTQDEDTNNNNQQTNTSTQKSQSSKQDSKCIVS